MKVDSIGPKCQVISHVRALGQLLIDIPIQICYKQIDITWEHYGEGPWNRVSIPLSSSWKVSCRS